MNRPNRPKSPKYSNNPSIWYITCPNRPKPRLKYSSLNLKIIPINMFLKLLELFYSQVRI
jgi:hypothetical protein